MEKFKKFYNKFFVIKVKWIFLLGLIAFPLVYFTLLYLPPDHYLSIISYVLSAYTFTVLCIRTPYIYRKTKELIKGEEVRIIVKIRGLMMKYKYTRMYLLDREFRAVISLYSGFTINLFYAIYRCTSGLYYNSNWFMAIGIYYLIFGFIRLFLIRRRGLCETLEFAGDREYLGYKTYRLCGILMFILNTAMSIMIIEMVVNKQSYIYYGNVIYFTAIYTFYYVISSITNVVRFYKNKNPILSASKNLTFAGALMSMFTLQTAMIAFFGSNDVERDIMNSVTGAIVTILVIALAIFMIIKGNRNIKKYERIV